MIKLKNIISEITQVQSKKLSQSNCIRNFHASSQNKLIVKLHTTFIRLSKEQIHAARHMTNKKAARYFFNIIADAMAVPLEIRPKFITKKIEEYAPRLSGRYIGIDNSLVYFHGNKVNMKLGKWWTFGLIRHEMEHYRQTIDVYRNKDLFKELCVYYSDLCKRLNASKEETDFIYKKLNDFRANILKYYPETNKNSIDYKQSKKYLNGMTNPRSYNYKTFKDAVLYFIQPVEFKACKVQGLNWINYLKTLIFG